VPSRSQIRLTASISLAGYLAALVGAWCLHDHGHLLGDRDGFAQSTHAPIPSLFGGPCSEKHATGRDSKPDHRQGMVDRQGNRKHRSKLPDSDEHCPACKFLATKPLSAPCPVTVARCEIDRGLAAVLVQPRSSSTPAGIPSSRAPPLSA